MTRPTPDHPGNPAIIPLDLRPVEQVKVNRSAIERRAATLTTRRTVKREWQAAWLLQAVCTIDLTTLAGDDTPGTVHRLCVKARQPIRRDLLAALGVSQPITVGAVCVYHAMVPTAVDALAGSDIPVAAVSTGFPAGQNPFEQKIQEIQASVAAGAREIDIVISRQHVLLQNWRALYDEVCAFREACGDAHMKTILATGELGTLKNVMRASFVCMQAGADFIKTGQATGRHGHKRDHDHQDHRSEHAAPAPELCQRQTPDRVAAPVLQRRCRTEARSCCFTIKLTQHSITSASLIMPNAQARRRLLIPSSKAGIQLQSHRMDLVQRGHRGTGRRLSAS